MPLYCPYCLTQQAFNRPVCGSCNKEIPVSYIQNARSYPPVWLVTFGYPGHGKTNAIHAMSIHIENIDKLVDKASYSYLDDPTVESMNLIRSSHLAANVNPPATAQTEHPPQPMLIELDGFPPKRTSTLVIYDLAGEAAVSPHENYVRAIQNAKTIWFIVSLTDLKGVPSRDDTQPRTINGLFMIYQRTMQKLKVPLQGRTILVNYTKADLFSNPQNGINLPESVRDYYLDDPYFDLVDAKRDDLELFEESEYRAKLGASIEASVEKPISAELKEFTRKEVPGGSAFITQVERNGMYVEFCITSSTGGSTGVTAISRYRVLDPLLWAIYLNDRVVEKTVNVALIIDPTLYSHEYPTSVYNELSRYGANVTTYHVGEKRYVYDSGQVPSLRPGMAQLPLIGPILDTLDSSNEPGQNIAILLLDHDTPLDLYDFRYTHWETNPQLFVITTHPETAKEWFNRKVLASTDADIGFVISDILEPLSKRG